MDSLPKTFTASIETTHGVSHQHPWHLGTQEPMARTIVMEIYANHLKWERPVLTVALMFDGKIIDVFDGKDWTNDRLEALAYEDYVKELI